MGAVEIPDVPEQMIVPEILGVQVVERAVRTLVPQMVVELVDLSMIEDWPSGRNPTSNCRDSCGDA